MLKEAISNINQRLDRENALLESGQIDAALASSETRGALLTLIEKYLQQVSSADEFRTDLKSLIARSSENSRLLKAALNGRVSAKQQLQKLSPSVGYDADGGAVGGSQPTMARSI